MKFALVIVLGACRAAQPSTVDQACALIVSAVCERRLECGIARADCYEAELDACCRKEPGLCRREPLEPEASVACAEALPSASCEQLGTGGSVPAACVGAATPREP